MIMGQNKNLIILECFLPITHAKLTGCLTIFGVEVDGFEKFFLLLDEAGLPEYLGLGLVEGHLRRHIQLQVT